MKHYLPFLLLYFSITPVFGQGEANIWYFGFGAGLDFNNSPPTALTDGMLSTDEGCSSICDAFGNLLFYTNGETIYNRNHQIMENGEGLGGHFSTTQSALIVPQPLSEHLYLVFTIGAQAGHGTDFDGLTYSIVDMDLDNGNGEVIEKNLPLLSYTTEKQTAVRHANGRDIWIVTHLFESDEFYSFLVTCDGVDTNPIISKVGKKHIEPDVGCCYGNATLGCIKSSPDNRKIAATWTEMKSVQNGSAVRDWHLEIFDFDNALGKLSNPISLSYGNGSNIHNSYGICFSPDNTKLYQGVYQGVPSCKLFQYDLTANDIPASQTIITEEYIKAFGTMEIGPDGKIYIARTNGHQYLSVLHNPNLSGANCNYEKEGVSLDGKNSTWGLPNILYDYSFKVHFDFLPNDTLLCDTESLLLNMDDLETNSFLWSDGSTSSSIEIKDEGLHWLEIETESCETGRDHIYVAFENCNCDVVFPNAFTPNGDGTNDFFEPFRVACDFEFYDLKIFNRWGAVVFETTDKNQAWDGYFKGKPSSEGVYVYILSFKNPGEKAPRKKVGDVSLLK